LYFCDGIDKIHIVIATAIKAIPTLFGEEACRFRDRLMEIGQQTLRVLVADDGIGIQQSLSQYPKYADISEAEALKVCIEDSVTDGKGMGFGLYSTSLLAKNVGIRFEIHSGTHKLQLKNNEFEVTEAEPWQGTLVFLEVHTNREIDPNAVVANRTDCISQYNEEFLDKAKIEDLW